MKALTQLSTLNDKRERALLVRIGANASAVRQQGVFVNRVSLSAKPSATKKSLLRLSVDCLGCRVSSIVAGSGGNCGTAKTP